MDVDQANLAGRDCKSPKLNLEEYLDDLEIERSALIMQLRRIDLRLQQYGRLKVTHQVGTYIDRSRP